MKLSHRSEYALRAMVELAVNYTKGEPVTLVSEIAENNKIPPKYLEQVLRSLKNAGYLEAKRGIGGGYFLKTAPKNISLEDILQVVEGPLTVTNELGNTQDQNIDEVSVALNDVMSEVDRMISKVLGEMSLMDIVQKSSELKELKNKVINYSI